LLRDFAVEALAGVRQLHCMAMRDNFELVAELRCPQHPGTRQLCPDNRKGSLAKQAEPLSEQAGADARPCVFPNHCPIPITQFVTAEDHPPKVREPGFLVVVASRNVKESRERGLHLHLIVDCVNNQRNAVQANLVSQIFAGSNRHVCMPPSC
jgi:hypothetical protein